MKRLLLTLAAMLMVAASIAKPVDFARARAIVENNFFAPARAIQPADWSELYIFVRADAPGFVIISADDCTRPVLAYSLTGQWPEVGDPMPAHVAAWLDGYRREIASLVAAGATPSAEVQAMWDNPVPKTDITVVEPLMTTTWNQRPLYNLLCPYDTIDSAYCVAGCTATATSQIMKYWNHPEVGWGNHAYYLNNYGVLSAVFDTTHYRWNLMPNALTSLSDSAEIMAVAELTYHVGVAVNMNYSPSGSGAAVNSHGYANYPSAETALKTYFKYNPLLRSIYKAEHSDAEWDSMIVVEIMASRPVLYAGYDSAGGHAFVLDGIDSLGMFHVNWGWGGHYDGYYTTDSLSPGAGGVGGNATYTFNMNNSAVIGIYPIMSATDSVAVVDMRYDATMGTVTGNGTYTILVDDVAVCARAAEGYRFVRWASGSTENPLYFLAVGDVSDSAIFAPVFGDTVGYCDNNYRSSWHDDYGDTTQWAIRLPAAVRNGHRSLAAVQYIPYQQGTYNLDIYIADSINGATPVYSKQLVHGDMGVRQWVTHTLDSALWLADSATVWIAFTYVGDGYPATMGRYCGVSDGIWYHLPWGWVQYDIADEVFYTWMLRGIFAERPVVVDINTHMNEEEMQLGGISVVGAGQYNAGDTVTVTVDPGISFSWNWGDEYNAAGDQTNPLVFVAENDTTLSVWFAYCIGIDDVESTPVRVAVIGRTVSVDIPEGTPFAAYDLQGRLIATRRTFTAPAAGVYLLQVDGQPAGRIVIR